MEEQEQQTPQRNSTITAIIAVVILIVSLAAVFFYISSREGSNYVAPLSENKKVEIPFTKEEPLTTEVGNEAEEGDILPAGQPGLDADLQVD